MRPRAALVVIAATVTTVTAVAPLTAEARAPRHDALGTIELDGVPMAVRWTDGDSFTFREGPHRGRRTRLDGYNCLEAYGPVHAWGAWKAPELFELAAGASQVAASRTWVCTTDGKVDGYHRLLVSCPELAVEMAREGYGLAYAVEGKRADPRVLAAQHQAQAAGRGLWRRGVVKGVLTSVHSFAEVDAEAASDGATHAAAGGGAAGDAGTNAFAYNRVVDTRTGQALRRPHRNVYRTCELVCEDTEGDRSCMVYVPFQRRYTRRPACLEVSPSRARPDESDP